jgi:chromosome segregation ATPase
MPSINRAETEAKIRELRRSIDQLEQELQLQDSQAEDQHRAIEHLEDYIDAVDTRLSSLRSFWETLKNEWRRSGD